MKTNYPTAPALTSWSWQEIQGVYRTYGVQLRELQRQAKIFDIDLPFRLTRGEVIGYPGDKFKLVVLWCHDVGRISQHLDALDREIARRNNLIGVVG